MTQCLCINCNCRADSALWRTSEKHAAWPRYDPRAGIGLCPTCADLTGRWDRGERTPLLPCPTMAGRPMITVQCGIDRAQVDAEIADKLQVPDGYRFRSRNQFFAFLVDVSEELSRRMKATAEPVV